MREISLEVMLAVARRMPAGMVPVFNTFNEPRGFWAHPGAYKSVRYLGKTNNCHERDFTPAEAERWQLALLLAAGDER